MSPSEPLLLFQWGITPLSLPFGGRMGAGGQTWSPRSSKLFCSVTLNLVKRFWNVPQ